MKIYEAGPSEIKQLMDLITEFWAESGYEFDRPIAKSALLHLMEDSTLGKIWLAKNDETPVGYIVLTLSFSLEFFGRTAFIEDFFVRPDSREEGIGRKLLQALIRECECLNIKALHVEVGDTNDRAMRLYLSNGLQATERKLLTRRFEE